MFLDGFAERNKMSQALAQTRQNEVIFKIGRCHVRLVRFDVSTVELGYSNQINEERIFHEVAQ